MAQASPAPRSLLKSADGKTRTAPTLHTFSWIGLGGAMAYAGAVQANGAAYLLAFLTFSLGALSFVLGRGNLRGLTIRRCVPTADGRLRIELHATTRHAPCGVEILAVGASQGAFIERIESGGTRHVSLPAPQHTTQPPHLLLRSAFPLGLFQTRRLLILDSHPHATPPEASGHLPLPAPTKRSDSGGQTGPPGREGDDFAGLREWQPGDSPRHIDWRAVARGRPLLVKTWSSATGTALTLDWNHLPLPANERAGQLARWIQQAENAGHAYALHLPSEVISEGRGEAHARRCLLALGRVQTNLRSNATTAPPPRLPPSHEFSACLPPRPLALLSGLILLAALPLWDVVPTLSLLMLAGALLYRNLSGQAVRQRWLPLAYAAVGVGGIYLSQGDLLNMEVGIGALLLLLGGKALESRAPHDFQVAAMIGWFLCLCGVLTDQSLVRSACMLALFTGITGCMLRFRRGSPGMAEPARMTLRMLIQAAPLTLLLFLLFPRVNLEALSRLGMRQVHQTGIPTSLDPGRVSQLVRSTATAFRVSFPDGTPPPNHQRYWRCVVLWECDGLSWSRGSGFSLTPHAKQSKPGDIRQSILLEPHGQIWLPALDYPIAGNDNQESPVLLTDRVLSALQPVRSVRRLEVTSRPLPTAEPLLDSERHRALQLPDNLSPNVLAIARQWREAGNDAAIVQAGLNYLRTSGFKYTLEPGAYPGPNALEEFLLHRRTGFCEHFSAAFATLMRAAGVPSRVIMGYLGGEPAMSGRLIVRQADAHAWTEVWLEHSGWIRLDPTTVLAPARLNLDLHTLLLGDEGALEERRNSLWWQASQQARLFWDDLNYRWYNAVIRFDEEAQLDWLDHLGLDFFNSTLLLALSGVGTLCLLGCFALWLRRPARESDPWARAWMELCRRLEKLGLPARAHQEGPLAYVRRAAAERPDIQTLVETYISVRYGQNDASISQFRRSVRRLRSGSKPH